MKTRVIVSRHQAGVDFIRLELPEFRYAPAIPSASRKDVEGVDVAGNLPLDLASKANKVFAILFAGSPPRGKEFTLADMIQSGAYIKCFTVEEEECREERRVK